MAKPLYDLYIACCKKEGGVVHTVLQDDGTLAVKERVSLSEPLYLALTENRLHALLCDPNETGESGYVSLSLSSCGTLGQPTPPVFTGGGEACYLSVCGDYVYVANYQTGSVARLSLAGERLLRTRDGHGADTQRQEASHPHWIAPAPDGRFWLCADLGTDTVVTYDRDLKEVGCAQTPAGQGPRHLVFSEDGRFVYCVNEIGNTVTVFSYADGVLTPLSTVEALPGEHGESYAAAVRLANGRLFVSHRGDDSLTVFSVSGETLTFEQTVSCGGRWPRDFALFGEFFVCTNEKSDSVTVLRQEDDRFVLCDTLSLPRPLCVVGRLHSAAD